MSSEVDSPRDGVTGGYNGNSEGMKITIATLAGLTLYSAVELIILVFVTFSQYRGGYFWSLLVSSIGLVPYAIGFLLKFFQLTSHVGLSVTFLTIGWWCMVTGQSLVLYSRLYLILPNPKVLHRVLAMIIIDAIVLHIPTTFLTYGCNLASANQVPTYVKIYNIMEKIQMAGFCLQEFIISALYISETMRMLCQNSDKSKRKIMYQLIAINLLLILMDLGLLVVINCYILETMMKGLIYSIKLKLEFAVLGKLVDLVRIHVWKPESVVDSQPEFPDFVDVTRINADITHALPAGCNRSHPWMDLEDVSIAMFEHSGPERDHETERLEVASRCSSGETQMNIHYSNRKLSPIDFTDSFHPQSGPSNLKVDI